MTIASSPDGYTDEMATVRVACAVCRNEIPVSEAVVPEATDYLIHLCGVDCYEQWRRAGEAGA
jgi:hypothetical protein